MGGNHRRILDGKAVAFESVSETEQREVGTMRLASDVELPAHHHAQHVMELERQRALRGRDVSQYSSVRSRAY